jgi:biopolymer transport protein ExbD
MILSRKRDPVEIPQASLADMAFLILIFFIVTTTIDLDKGIPMVLPDRGGEFKVNPENICNILVNATGQVLVDDEPTDMALVQEMVRTKVRARGMDSDGNPKLIVSIKTERSTPYNDFVQVLDEVKLAGATKISIAEPEK